MSDELNSFICDGLILTEDSLLSYLDSYDLTAMDPDVTLWINKLASDDWIGAWDEDTTSSWDHLTEESAYHEFAAADCRGEYDDNQIAD